MDIYLMAALFLLLVITFQFITAPRLSLLEYWDAVNHNEEFLKNNPDFISTNQPLSHMISYFLGVIFIFTIGFGVIVKSEFILQLVRYSSILVFVGQYLCNHFYLKKIKQKIPNSKKRSTRLEQRNIYYFISKKMVFTLGIFLTIMLIGILAAFFMNKVSLPLAMRIFAPKMVLIVLLFSWTIISTQKSSFNSSKWLRNEKIIRASFTVVVFVVGGFLIDLYIRLIGIFFKMPHFIQASYHEYLLGAAMLGAFMHFVLNSKIDIPDWYVNLSLKK